MPRLKNTVVQLGASFATSSSFLIASSCLPSAIRCDASTSATRAGLGSGATVGAACAIVGPVIHESEDASTTAAVARRQRARGDVEIMNRRYELRAARAIRGSTYVDHDGT